MAAHSDDRHSTVFDDVQAYALFKNGNMSTSKKIFPEIDASVMTRVVSWNDAAEMNESVESDALREDTGSRSRRESSDARGTGPASAQRR